MASVQAVEWVLLDHEIDDPVAVGDVVSVDAGGMPIYQVMAVAKGRVWLGDDRHGAVRMTTLDSFRWKGAHAAA